MWPFRWVMHKKRGLRVWIMSMLASSPRNGVEIMKEIELMTRGWWRPSPGSVYPVLEQLTEDGLISKKDDGRYELTSKASEEIEWPFGPPFRRPQTIEDTLNEISGNVSYLEEMSRSEKAKTSPHLEKMRNLAERLSALAKTKKS